MRRALSNDLCCRGMGMFLIQALVDEAEWHQGPPGKSFERLVIKLDKEK